MGEESARSGSTLGAAALVVASLVLAGNTATASPTSSTMGAPEPGDRQLERRCGRDKGRKLRNGSERHESWAWRLVACRLWDHAEPFHRPA